MFEAVDLATILTVGNNRNNHRRRGAGEAHAVS